MPVTAAASVPPPLASAVPATAALLAGNAVLDAANKIKARLAGAVSARFNLNVIFDIEFAGGRVFAAGKPDRGMTFGEASAMKLYAARAAVEVAMEAVQVFGGNGYMAEFQVEQLCRDAKVLQIYAGTDEIQISQIARSILGDT